MKRMMLLLLAILMLTTVFLSCKKAEEPTESPVVSFAPAPTPTPSPEPTEDPIPVNISPTTGKEGTTTKYQPIMVQIDNAGDARPQAGVQIADVVYETPVEGSYTRLTMLFNDVIYAEEKFERADDAYKSDEYRIIVGPVRSSRYYHQWIQSEWDALYVHMGGPDSTPNPVSDIWAESSKHIKQRINGAGKHAVNANMFLKNKKGSPLSHYAMTDLVADAAIMDYTPTPREPFKYYPLEEYANEKQIKTITMPFLAKADHVSYEYNAEKDKLLRFMGGKPFMADETGAQLEVQNLIIQYVPVGIMPKDSAHRLVDMFGEGKAEFVIHGKHMQGTWQRADVSVATKYYLANGEEITLTPGNTWIEVHPSDKEIAVEYAA